MKVVTREPCERVCDEGTCLLAGTQRRGTYRPGRAGELLNGGIFGLHPK